MVIERLTAFRTAEIGRGHVFVFFSPILNESKYLQYVEMENRVSRKQFSRNLRKRMTHPERMLWILLRKHRWHGLKFHRQVPIGKYIVDFLCPRYRLIIEVDGGYHLHQREYDAMREYYLRSKNYRILRFTNDQVEKNLWTVMQAIQNSIPVLKNKQHTSPLLPSDES